MRIHKNYKKKQSFTCHTYLFCKLKSVFYFDVADNLISHECEHITLVRMRTSEQIYILPSKTKL